MGTSSNLSTLTSGQPVYSQSALTIGSGSFNAAVGALNENTTYYYVAFMEVLVNGTYQEVYGTVKSFKTQASSTATTLNKDWLEAPESPASLNGKYLVTSRADMNGRNTRNYSILYDPSRYASLWTAYVLCSSHRGNGGSGQWVKHPDIPAWAQTSVWNTYGEIDGITYERGHQIPKADRNADGLADMLAQTFYWTNSTPQNKSFNGGVWGTLENQIRNAIPASDSLYIVTGPVYQTVGGNETVKTFVNSNGNNDGKYSSEEFDKLVDEARTTADIEEHYTKLHEAEQVLLKDAAMAPVAYYNDFWLQKPELKNTWHSPYGYWYVMYGTLE